MKCRENPGGKSRGRQARYGNQEGRRCRTSSSRSLKWPWKHPSVSHRRFNVRHVGTGCHSGIVVNKGGGLGTNYSHNRELKYFHKLPTKLGIFYRSTLFILSLSPPAWFALLQLFLSQCSWSPGQFVSFSRSKRKSSKTELYNFHFLCWFSLWGKNYRLNSGSNLIYSRRKSCDTNKWPQRATIDL